MSRKHCRWARCVEHGFCCLTMMCVWQVNFYELRLGHLHRAWMGDDNRDDSIGCPLKGNLNKAKWKARYDAGHFV